MHVYICRRVFVGMLTLNNVFNFNLLMHDVEFYKILYTQLHNLLEIASTHRLVLFSTGAASFVSHFVRINAPFVIAHV
jgi:hypothetical protein